MAASLETRRPLHTTSLKMAFRLTIDFTGKCDLIGNIIQIYSLFNKVFVSVGISIFSDEPYKLEKGFQKKPIVAFTNSTVFILVFNI